MINNRFALSQQLGLLCEKHKIRIGLAESCTGGLLSSDLTLVTRCSKWFDGCLVVYSNAAKMTCLNVQEKTLNQMGAVSESVVKEMAQGVINQLQSDIAFAISGIAGPGGGTIDKPVGTVCFALADKKTGFFETRTQRFNSGRQYVRLCAVEYALQWLVDYISLK